MSRKAFIWTIVCCFLAAVVCYDFARVRNTLARTLNLPEPVAFFTPSPEHLEPELTGLSFDPQRPLDLKFIIDTHGQKFTGNDKRFILENFILALTIPERDLWVNLSPDEPDRIMKDEMAGTLLGETLLKQDYKLKLFAASSAKAFAPQTGDMNQKVWIRASDASLVEHGTTVVIDLAGLTVETEGESSVFTELVLPAIRREVARGGTFSDTRALYRIILLAQWFKDKVAGSDFDRLIGSGKIAFQGGSSSLLREKIFHLYRESSSRGVYDQIRNGRRYFSGGIELLSGEIKVSGVGQKEMTDRTSGKGIITLSSALTPVSSSVLTQNDRVGILNLMETYRAVARGGGVWDICQYDGPSLAVSNVASEEVMDEVVQDLLSDSVERKLAHELDVIDVVFGNICDFMRSTFVKRIFLHNAAKLGAGRYVFYDLDKMKANAYVPDFFQGSGYEDFNDFVLFTKVLLSTDVMKVSFSKKGGHRLEISLTHKFSKPLLASIEVGEEVCREINLRKGIEKDKNIQADIFLNLFFGRCYRDYMNFVAERSGLLKEVSEIRERQAEEAAIAKALTAKLNEEKLKEKKAAREARKEKRGVLMPEPISQAKKEPVPEVPPDSVPTALEQVKPPSPAEIEKLKISLMEKLRPAENTITEIKRLTRLTRRKLTALDRSVLTVRNKMNRIEEMASADYDEYASDIAAIEETMRLNDEIMRGAYDKIDVCEGYVSNRIQEIKRLKQLLKKADDSLKTSVNAFMRRAGVSMPEMKAEARSVEQRIETQQNDIAGILTYVDRLLEDMRRKRFDEDERIRENKYYAKERQTKEKELRTAVNKLLHSRFRQDQRFKIAAKEAPDLFSELGLMKFSEYFAAQIKLDDAQVRKGYYDDENSINSYIECAFSYVSSDDVSALDAARLAFAGISVDAFNQFLIEYNGCYHVETGEMIDIWLMSKFPDFDLRLLQAQRSSPGELPSDNASMYKGFLAEFYGPDDVLLSLSKRSDILEKIIRRNHQDGDDSEYWADQKAVLDKLIVRLKNRERVGDDYSIFIRYLLGIENNYPSGSTLDEEISGDLEQHMKADAEQRGMVFDEAHYVSVLRGIDMDPSRRVLLVHGPAGTGKTTVLSHLVAQLTKAGEYVQVVTHTNPAAHRVVEAISKHDPSIPMLRLAKTDMRLSDDEKQKFWSGNPTVFRNYERLIGEKPEGEKGRVFVGSGTGFYADSHASDDNTVVIVDEASQMSPMEFLCAVTRACGERPPKKVIVIGDHSQLPVSDIPLDGLDLAVDDVGLFQQSIFDYMADRRLFDQVMLSTCYRMDPAVSLFLSAEYYGGRLIPVGKPADKNAFDLRDISSARSHHSDVNVEQFDSSESRISKKNVYSAGMVGDILSGLAGNGNYRQEDIFVVTPYQGQKDEITSDLSVKRLNKVEVRTIDSVQGDERLMSVVDMVLAGNIKQSFMTRNRSLVAFSRGEKLIVVADLAAWENYPNPEIARIFQHMRYYNEKLQSGTSSSSLGGIDLRRRPMITEPADVSGFELDDDITGLGYFFTDTPGNRE